MIEASEFVRVTNEVHDLIIDSTLAPELGEQERRKAKALAVSCEFLRRISGENLQDAYERVIKEANNEATRISAGVTAIEIVISSESHFHDFLRLEFELLTKAGMEPHIAKFVIEEVEKNINHIKSNQASTSDFLFALAQLTNHVCGKSNTIRDALHDTHRGRQLILTFGGLSLIGVNILLGPGFLSPIGAGASSAIGGGLFVAAVKTLIVLPLAR